MAGTRVTRTPSVVIDGKAVTSEVDGPIVGLEVLASLAEGSRVMLRIDDPWFEHFDSKAFDVGAVMEVKLPNAKNTLVSVFTGHVTAVGVEHDDAEGETPVLVVEARDGVQRLRAASSYETYLEQKASDIASAVAGRHGLKANVEATKHTEPYVLQTGTDHDLLTELARRVGYEWFVRNGELHFRSRPDPSGPTLKRADGSLTRFSAVAGGAPAPKSVTLHGWDPDTQKPFEGVVTDVGKAKGPAVGSDAPFVADQVKKTVSTFGKPLNLGTVASRDQGAATTAAEGVAAAFAGAGLRVAGSGPCNPDVEPGKWVTIEGMGKRLSGAYYVTEVRHEFGVGLEVVTSFATGGDRSDGSPPIERRGAGASVPGPLPAIVTNTKDPENLGRVKVKFPSLGEADSDWARVVGLGAGKDRGFDFRPEVNDEVMVVFERGDVRFPVVLGTVWNKKAAPSSNAGVADGLTTSRVIRSRTGHSLAFIDGDKNAKEADRGIEVETGNSAVKVVMNEKSGVKIETTNSDGDIVLKTAGGASLTLKGDGTIELKTGSKAVTVEGKDVTVKAAASMTIKGGTGVKVDGGPNLEMKGAQGKLEGSAMLTLKGGMVKIN